MPSAHIVVESPTPNSFRAASMSGMFDIPVSQRVRHEWDVDLPIEDVDWNIGLIVGASGSGKSTIARHMFGKYIHKDFKWSRDKSLLDDFQKDLSVKDICAALSHVGFSSPPSWLKPYHVLSTGQKFRVNVARILCESDDLVVIDEFTSVIDRTVARVGCVAVAKAIRRKKKQIICISCHKDIISWLCPDWLYDVDSKSFSRRRLRRPKIKLDIYKSDHHAWEHFKEHHYLSANISKGIRAYVATIEDMPVAFTSLIPTIGVKRLWREHRTVVLPDYQGVGIGNALLDAMGELFKAEGLRLRSTTAHHAYIASRARNPKWKIVKQPSLGIRMISWSNTGTNAATRLVCTFEFKGESDKHALAGIKGAK